MARKTPSRKLGEIHQQALRRFDQASNYNSEVRRRSALCRKFTSVPGGQWLWDEEGDFGSRMKLEINKTEAAHASIFVAGWRPASGWICNIGLAYTFLLQPLLTWACSIAGVAQPPGIPFDALYVLLGSLLGVGTLRTVDKVKGVAS